MQVWRHTGHCLGIQWYWVLFSSVFHQFHRIKSEWIFCLRCTGGPTNLSRYNNNYYLIIWKRFSIWIVDAWIRLPISVREICWYFYENVWKKKFNEEASYIGLKLVNCWVSLNMSIRYTGWFTSSHNLRSIIIRKRFVNLSKLTRSCIWNWKSLNRNHVNCWWFNISTLTIHYNDGYRL